MDKLLNTIIRFLPLHMRMLLALHIIILGGILYIGNLERLMSFDPQQMYNKIPILTIAITAILLYLVLLIFYVVLSFKIHKKLKLEFGVLWDKDKKPYCPRCKIPLTTHPAKFEGSTITGIDCIKCDKSFTLMNDKGKRITLVEAKNLL